MFLRFLACLICLPLLAQDAGQEDMEVQAKAAADLRARIEATPRLPFNGVHFAVQGSALKGLVSWLAVDGAGTIYEIQRGESADPVRERPETGSAFSGTRDIAFAPNGHLFITDGYGNARVVECTSDGKRVKQWGKPGRWSRGVPPATCDPDR
jgi:hypothetical protein